MIKRVETSMCHSTLPVPMKRGPKTRTGQARQFTVSLEPLTYERARALAARDNLPVAAVIRGLLERGLANV